MTMHWIQHNHLLVLAVLILAGSFFFCHRAQAGPYAALVAELESERPLFERNANELRYPASLTKMMTLYLVFESLAKGEITSNTVFRASRYAVLRPPSRLGLQAGNSITVEQGILALVTRSANDAAAVIAEGMAGSESAFAQLMTEKARELGMSRTVYRNASGLPDPNQVTTAWDQFRLGKSLYKDFPQYYPYFSTTQFQFQGRSFHNHNHLLKTYPGADGIKTGFVNASGFNLVASARRGGYRLIGVVFGGTSASARDAHMRDILDYGFAQLDGREYTIRTVSFDEPEPPALLSRPKLPERSGQKPSSKKKVKLADNTSPSNKGENERRKDAWQVRVGSFTAKKSAEQRLTQALKAAPYPLRHARAMVAARTKGGKKLYLAVFNGMKKEDAVAACKALKRKRIECISGKSSS
ncbi:D-alanyl-D-alanine carboxypeptidase [Methylocaldum szegediense]|nr:D-alanyl-D-alanine carboxypeptidase [Methylocaldum szegediense]